MLSKNQLILLSIFSLTACGGSSDNADSDLIPPPITDALARCEVQSNLKEMSSSSNISF